MCVPGSADVREPVGACYAPTSIGQFLECISQELRESARDYSVCIKNVLASQNFIKLHWWIRCIVNGASTEALSMDRVIGLMRFVVSCIRLFGQKVLVHRWMHFMENSVCNFYAYRSDSRAICGIMWYINYILCISSMLGSKDLMDLSLWLERSILIGSGEEILHVNGCFGLGIMPLEEGLRRYYDNEGYMLLPHEVSDD